jgi:hypothetical protein
MVDYLLTKEELFLRVMDWTGTENIDVVFSRIVAQTLKLEWKLLCHCFRTRSQLGVQEGRPLPLTRGPRS